MAPAIRTFLFDGEIISTFEQDPACDPAVIKTTDLQNIKYDILFPELLPTPLRRNPVPSESRPMQSDPLRGFPIRWSVPELVWAPYLPAVVTYHYPIFRNMVRSPEIIAVEGGFVLQPTAVAHWSNVEHVMQNLIEKLKADASMSQHRRPFPPSSYGYRRTFRKRKDARSAISPSIAAFQHTLAYCSYTIASTDALHFPRSQHRSLYENPAQVATLLERMVSEDVRDSSHTLLKLLWATLGEIHQTRNFVGAAVTYDRPYDCKSIHDMHLYGVPVFIRWSSRFRLQSYSPLPQNELLTKWRPSTSSFAVSDQPQHPPSSHSSTASAQQPPPSPPAALDRHVDSYPLQYVERRKDQISSSSNKPQAWLERERSAKSFESPGKSGARVYQFALENQKWERRLLTRAEAGLLWKGIDPCNLWFDCVSNQWNYCHQFNFVENAGAHNSRYDSDDDDDGDYMEELLPPQLERSDTSALHDQHLTFRPDEDVQVADGFSQEQNSADSMGGGSPTEAPSFDNSAYLTHLLSAQHDTPSEYVNSWSDVGDFLYKRYGLEHISDEEDHGKKGTWSTKLGIVKNTPSVSFVELYDCVTEGAWPPSICDLSPGLAHTDSFPNRSPNAALCLRPVINPQGYIVTAEPGRNVDWKLLIQDPLTLLQIEREGWDCDPGGLVVNLIKKGVPFQILNPQNLEGAQFYDHPGPVIHPVGKKPRHVDYLAYRQELGDFFAQYPHAYAAALSAGGILWRIAMDVLPLPDEFDITRQFHPNGCVSLTVDGNRYWSPKLTQLEEEVIVGVYRWAVSAQHSPREDSWWPKPQVWSESGLQFGAWSPLDEDWYGKRGASLDTEAASCVNGRDWKEKIKYQGRDAGKFLACARSLARTFVSESRL